VDYGNEGGRQEFWNGGEDLAKNGRSRGVGPDVLTPDGSEKKESNWGRMTNPASVPSRKKKENLGKRQRVEANKPCQGGGWSKN